MVVFIPAIFILILSGVLLYYMGVNVGERVQQTAALLPFIEAEKTESETSFEEKIAQLEHENSSYITQIDQLENQLRRKEDEVSRLQEELLIAKQDEEKQEDEIIEERGDIREAVRTLEGMSASKAANIFSELNQEEAVNYLRHMNVDSRSQILSRMDAGEAAELVSLLSGN